ncbi:MAG: hypothetical protein KJ040_10395 [Gammaproteobacteria bacterium]|nr:hypothetical protein [Gammaproteobacteria bacterium]
MDNASTVTDAPDAASSTSATVHRAGIAEMSADGTLTITMFGPERDRDLTSVYRPGDRNYESARVIADGILPGERKDIPRYLASVDMEADGTIIYARLGPDADPLVARRYLKPGTPEYQEIMLIVPDLKPGTFRMIPEGAFDHVDEPSSPSSAPR